MHSATFASSVILSHTATHSRSSGTCKQRKEVIPRLERASANTHLVPGDVIGSGTVGTGCILEHGDGRWLRPGDEVELEVDGIGVLRNRVAASSGKR